MVSLETNSVPWSSQTQMVTFLTTPRSFSTGWCKWFKNKNRWIIGFVFICVHFPIAVPSKKCVFVCEAESSAFVVGDVLLCKCVRISPPTVLG